MKRSILVVSLLAYFLLASCKISDPTWAVPAITDPNGHFTASITGKVLSAYLVNSDGNYVLTVSSQSQGSVEFGLTNVPEGLYDLVVETEEGTCYQPNAVWVTKELKEVTLMHVTDTHIGVFTDRPAREYLMASVIIANSDPNVNLVVNTGDIADTSMPYQYQINKEVFSLLTKPLLVVPGNHDALGMRDFYSEIVGPRKWYREFDEFLFLAVDSGADGYISLDQAKWAYSILTTSKAKNKVVMFHHPLFAYVYDPKPHSFTANSWEELYDLLLSKPPNSRFPYIYTSWLQNEDALKTFIKGIYEGETTLTLSGHIHVDSYAEVKTTYGKAYFITTTTQGGPVREGDYHGFRIIRVKDRHVEAYGFGKPWERNASYSLEGVYSHYKFSDDVSAVTFKLVDPRLEKLLPQLILAVPSKGEGYGIYAPGAIATWKECTPGGCTYYAKFPAPKLNQVYVMAVYKEDDAEAPVIKVKTPTSISPYKPFQLRFEVTDSGWGVAEVKVKLSGVAQGEYVLYSQTKKYKLNLMPIRKNGILNVTISAMDFKGHLTQKSFQVKVGEVTQVATTTTTTSTITKEVPSAQTQVPVPLVAAAILLVIIAAFLLI
ncbi:hypothetical protein EYM_05295 [Ignicoccus islandicus DSM 13165]|uniref:Calcineurin-like phosphoesterase domain-containing protein n=1 Tax=Ignicoccus islandicus DSM 13165 TaxID=940295 RepID=A0A0U2MB53_9CREN|nr:metallophosphoesterase [Ignicoccus islandicus]ALU12573.1 hypothetical protein EYM_05295 [Ignicoccus islandicus DSM 13165]